LILSTTGFPFSKGTKALVISPFLDGCILDDQSPVSSKEQKIEEKRKRVLVHVMQSRSQTFLTSSFHQINIKGAYLNSELTNEKCTYIMMQHTPQLSATGHIP